MQTTITYRCPRKCPIRKECFILKVPVPLTAPLEVLQKCPAEKGRDIAIIIGDNKRPP